MAAGGEDSLRFACEIVGAPRCDADCHNLVTKSRVPLCCAATGPSLPPGVRGRCTPPSRAVGCATHHDVRTRPRRRPFATPSAGAPTADAQAEGAPRRLSATGRTAAAPRAAPSLPLNDLARPSMLARADNRRSSDHATLTFVRYVDVVLVLASAPFVFLAHMPRLGYVIGAGGWILTRFAVGADQAARLGGDEHAHARGAAPHGDPRQGLADRGDRPRRALRRPQRRRHHGGGGRARGVHGRARDLGGAARRARPGRGEPAMSRRAKVWLGIGDLDRRHRRRAT